MVFWASYTHSFLYLLFKIFSLPSKSRLSRHSLSHQLFPGIFYFPHFDKLLLLENGTCGLYSSFVAEITLGSPFFFLNVSCSSDVAVFLLQVDPGLSERGMHHDLTLCSQTTKPQYGLHYGCLPHRHFSDEVSDGYSDYCWVLDLKSSPI